MFTHGLSVNWRDHKTLADEELADESIDRLLHRLDGQDRWGLSLWALQDPDPVAALTRAAAKEFLQSAGSAQAMSIELMVREPRDDGECALYTIGKPVGDEPGDTTISWRDKTITVKTNEVFTADEATEVYRHYRQHDDVPDTFTRRFIEAYAE